MKKIIALVAFIIFCTNLYGQTAKQDLHFDVLAKQWDEAIPLGNGMVGALVWQKADHLRFSLDRADLWDMRPMKGLHRPEFSYQWVVNQVNKKDYAPVQQYFDAPYDREPGPSKIPGGALEFDTKGWGKVTSVNLHLANALCQVKWANGVTLKTFVHATAPVGWFRFENMKTNLVPQLISPKYQGEVKISADPVGGDDLSRLGYSQGSIKQQGNNITYIQKGWGGFTYQINVQWKKINATTIEGVWSISSQNTGKKINTAAAIVAKNALAQGYAKDYVSHSKWWQNFWSKSAIHVPDTLLEKQWYLEQYKFGSASRLGAPIISLQAVWTADNGRLPPWKGDFHHDLNTQLSYWPSYSSNHLEDGMAYLDNLDANKANYKRYTKLYFGSDGLAVPGVTTLDGTEMGGWIQYALSPSVSSWLGQHYYLQWRYSMDKDFLRKRAYPWVKDAATFIENITVLDSAGHRKLPISSSPEINDNDITAWFHQNTNYDLSLMKFTFKAAAEMADELGLKNEASHWRKIAAEYSDFALTSANELKFAPSMAYNQSHRHFSHMMSIYPLGLIKWEDGPRAQSIIKNSIHLLDSIGPAYWCGYSYSWLANMKARAKDGEGAAKDLTIFAKAFCSVNSFHLNGDQTKSGYSKFQYRPFTLEGNFAFASGLQEMLIQSYAGFIEIMPAVPSAWKDVSFENLRTEGAFLLSVKKSDGQVTEVKIVSEKGGKTKLKLPFKTWVPALQKDVEIDRSETGFVSLNFKPGAILVLKNAYE
ncbi:glycosyl hydrolase family 95 catalytic domain-containing protein [Mucilaginibacter sp. SP1R1]|uniref:glycosyl hydrolase family 95 catalytic domain-containing protein n=1 Tax=Mucilaginibacter sp. SP1R1 TaxID=2723091 RepID=UPI00160D5548|nr:glycoside hydrolase N-terminal domain-containing protein [Mucilaginibacter sp. SP1R1]MBB6151111.1 alpha-L-fucosidase 2 [Mucilaginibacter sp. SP1R1]